MFDANQVQEAIQVMNSNAKLYLIFVIGGIMLLSISIWCLVSAILKYIKGTCTKGNEVYSNRPSRSMLYFNIVIRSLFVVFCSVLVYYTYHDAVEHKAANCEIAKYAIKMHEITSRLSDDLIKGENKYMKTLDMLMEYEEVYCNG